MNKDIREKFPIWCDLGEVYTLCLSNDLDSLLSCIFLKQIKGYEISHFYKFDTIGKIQGHKHTAGSLIGVDISLTKGKTWDNHVAMLSKDDKFNINSANLNIVNRISRDNYTSKYCGSTVLQILSYYDYDISNLSEEGKMILLAIDGTYIPFFPWKIDFSGTIRNYLKQMEYEELIEVAERHTQAEFEGLIDKYNLNAIITIKKGYLHTDIDLAELSKVFLMPISLPKDGFELLKEFKQDGVPLTKGNYNITKPDGLFSIAVTGRDYYKYSTIKKKGELVC